MIRTILATATALAVSTGAAFAADGPVTPAPQPLPQNGFYSGYLFPDDGSPSGEQPDAIPVLVPPTPTGIGGVYITHIYLYPPAEGSDSGGTNG